MTNHGVIDRLDRVTPIIREGATAVDRDGAFPADQILALAEAGLLGLILPTDSGGLGGGPRDLVDAMLGVASACGSTAMVYLMHLSASAVMAAAPPADGGDRLLEDLASGAKLATLAFSEKGSSKPFLGASVKSDPDSARIGHDRGRQELGDLRDRCGGLCRELPRIGRRGAHGLKPVRGRPGRCRSQSAREVRRCGPSGQRLRASST